MKIVIDQHGIVVVDGGNGIEQRRHEVGFRIPDAGGVLPYLMSWLWTIDTL